MSFNMCYIVTKKKYLERDVRSILFVATHQYYMILYEKHEQLEYNSSFHVNKYNIES